jgi:1-acyl-sn-glycerol-3-phosphate acyltransferase
MTLLYCFCRRTAYFCFSAFGRLEVIGREIVPPYGPLIVVSNHISHNDAAALIASFPRPLNFLGKQELFRTPVHRLVMEQLGVYPVRRLGTSLEGIRGALKLLAQGRAVAIFPEGVIGSGLSLREGQLGAAYLAVKSQAPIIPVGIIGTEKFPPWRMPFPLQRIQVRMGRPFTPLIPEGKRDRRVLARVRDMIMQHIAILLLRGPNEIN